MKDLRERLRDEGWCPISEAAEIIGLPCRKIYRMIEKDNLAHQRVGGEQEYKREARRPNGVLYVNLAQIFKLLGKDLADLTLRQIPTKDDVPTPQSFLVWLRDQQFRSDSIGSFCGQFYAERSRPRNIVTMNTLVSWWCLRKKVAPDDAIQLITPVWNAWRRYYIATSQKALQHEQAMLPPE